MLKNCKIAGIGVDSEVYHSQPYERGDSKFAMSPSSLKAFLECPERWIKGYESPDSDAKDWGNLLDLFALTPEKAKDRIAIVPPTYVVKGMQCPTCKSVTDSKKCKACGVDRVEVSMNKDWSLQATECKEWRLKQGDKQLVTQKELVESGLAVNRLREDETLASLFDSSNKQVHVVGEWHDESTGLIIPVQCLIDLVPSKDTEWQKALADLKSTRNAGQRQFAKWSYQAGYHVQAAFDLAMYNAATGENRTEWIFALSENYPPYQTGRRILRPDNADPDRDETLLGIGRATFKRALRTYAQCLKTGLWASYDEPEAFTEILAEPWQAFEESTKMSAFNYDASLTETEPESLEVTP